MLVWIIVCSILIVACVPLAFVFAFKGKDDIAIPFAFGGAASFIALFILILSYVNLQEVINEHIANIVSIKRSAEVEGSFCLGSGYVDSKQYYFYYCEVEPNKFKLGKIETDRSYIIEDNDKTPSIYKLKAKGEWTYHYDIYVPVGTILTTFVLE